MRIGERTLMSFGGAGRAVTVVRTNRRIRISGVEGLDGRFPLDNSLAPDRFSGCWHGGAPAIDIAIEREPVDAPTIDVSEGNRPDVREELTRRL